jgi:5'-phosphate synthase pdxT subunit
VSGARLRVGVLALQGDVREHLAVLDACGAAGFTVRRIDELASADAIILPGGESTTIDKLLRAFGLFEPLRERLRAGLPALGTCAGMILLADSIVDGTADQQTLGGIPMTVRRNAFGRQVDSSEAEISWRPDGTPMHATFIRAPWVETLDPAVEVLAQDDHHGGRVVAVRHGALVATAFHPELTGETRVHRLLIDLANAAA